MNFIKKPAIMASILAMLIPALSQASIVELDFSGSIKNLTYASCTALNARSCSAWSYTHPSTSSAYNGISLGIGNQFAGSFLYDTAIKYTLSSDGHQAIYMGGIKGGTLSLPNVAFSWQSNNGDSYSVVDNRYGDMLMLQDIFTLPGGDWVALTTVSLQDNSGKVYSSFTAPTTFNPAQYSYAGLQLTFLQRSTGDQLQLSGPLGQYTAVNSNAVSEPTTLLLALAGLGLMGFMLCRKTS